MPMYKKPVSPLGYTMLQNQIDSYGVDHSAFSTRDELEYQWARLEKEEELMKQENESGLMGDYTQYGTNFWGTSQDNNYGFGSTDIVPNIENIKARYWETASEGKKVYEDVLRVEGNVEPKNQELFNYINSAKTAYKQLSENKDVLANNKSLTDKFKHALLNCGAAQLGEGGVDMAAILSYLKEAKDLIGNSNTFDASFGDNYANKIGRTMGIKYPTEDCDLILQKYIKKYR